MSRTVAELEGIMVAAKQQIIDKAFAKFDIRSVAELGCVWGVDCVYGRYIAEKWPGARVTCVDNEWNDSARAKVGALANMSMVDALIGDTDVPLQIGHVDAVILFWVLLHQVSPDWDAVLEMYAPHTDTFIIANPQWAVGRETIRLWKLGIDEYVKNVTVMDRLDEIKRIFADAENGKEFPAAHNYWQWGITNADLIEKMRSLGFATVNYANYGSFAGLKNFQDCYFLFHKPQ